MKRIWYGLAAVACGQVVALLVAAPVETASRLAQERNQTLDSQTPSGELVTFWNVTGINTIVATPLGPRGAPLASRAMAMMHVAMADAVFSIHPKYESYAVRITGHRNANKTAAAAAAAYGVLARYAAPSENFVPVVAPHKG